MNDDLEKTLQDASYTLNSGNIVGACNQVIDCLKDKTLKNDEIEKADMFVVEFYNYGSNHLKQLEDQIAEGADFEDCYSATQAQFSICLDKLRNIQLTCGPGSEKLLGYHNNLIALYKTIYDLKFNMFTDKNRLKTAVVAAFETLYSDINTDSHQSLAFLASVSVFEQFRFENQGIIGGSLNSKVLISDYNIIRQEGSKIWKNTAYEAARSCHVKNPCKWVYHSLRIFTLEMLNNLNNLSYFQQTGRRRSALPDVYSTIISSAEGIENVMMRKAKTTSFTESNFVHFLYAHLTLADLIYLWNSMFENIEDHTAVCVHLISALECANSITQCVAFQNNITVLFDLLQSVDAKFTSLKFEDTAYMNFSGLLKTLLTNVDASTLSDEHQKTYYSLQEKVLAVQNEFEMGSSGPSNGGYCS
uniref:Uncharacterized protein n=1 Tax=Caenorhabditis japonica TaxID=281687 RepID=A0A8R1HVB0_CAEJA